LQRLIDQARRIGACDIECERIHANARRFGNLQRGSFDGGLTACDQQQVAPRLGEAHGKHPPDPA
jgi:hypothetical protein